MRRLIQQHGLRTKAEQKFVVTTRGKQKMPVGSDPAHHWINPDAPNHLWSPGCFARLGHTLIDKQGKQPRVRAAPELLGTLENGQAVRQNSPPEAGDACSDVMVALYDQNWSHLMLASLKAMH